MKKPEKGRSPYTAPACTPAACFSTHLLEAGFDIAKSSLDGPQRLSTMIYLHVSRETARQGTQSLDQILNGLPIRRNRPHGPLCAVKKSPSRSLIFCNTISKTTQTSITAWAGNTENSTVKLPHRRWRPAGALRHMRQPAHHLSLLQKPHCPNASICPRTLAARQKSRSCQSPTSMWSSPCLMSSMP